MPVPDSVFQSTHSIFNCRRKADVYFQKGSYWIYKDSVSGREDSCFVEYSRTFISEDSRYSRGLNQMEVLQVVMTQVPLDHSIKDTILRQILVYKDVLYLKGLELSLPIVDKSYSSGGYTESIRVLPLCTIAGKDYANVRSAYLSSIHSPNTAAIGYWLNEQGILKIVNKEDSLNQVWEVIRFKIVK